ncbi:hypothetical protein D9R06_11695 [Kocuria marina subsp. indica]|nr:hypothetical protein D9R06_11695 [Kocuria indica]
MTRFSSCPPPEDAGAPEAPDAPGVRLFAVDADVAPFDAGESLMVSSTDRPRAAADWHPFPMTWM